MRLKVMTSLPVTFLIAVNVLSAQGGASELKTNTVTSRAPQRNPDEVDDDSFVGRKLTVQTAKNHTQSFRLAGRDFGNVTVDPSIGVGSDVRIIESIDRSGLRSLTIEAR